MPRSGPSRANSLRSGAANRCIAWVKNFAAFFPGAEPEGADRGAMTAEQDAMFLDEHITVKVPDQEAVPSQERAATSPATVIVNADDWGRDCNATERTLD